jgi:hypothetical protein
MKAPGWLREEDISGRRALGRALFESLSYQLEYDHQSYLSMNYMNGIPRYE